MIDPGGAEEGDGRKGGDFRTAEEVARKLHFRQTHTHTQSADQRSENNSSSHSIISSRCP